MKLKTDSILSGFIRTFRDVNNGQGFEVWKTKKDKDPVRVFKDAVVEYAIGNDTVRVLHNFIPFIKGDLYYENVDARYALKGKINLLKIPNYKASGAPPIPFATPAISAQTAVVVVIPGTFKALSQTPVIYLLEDRKNRQFRALPPEKEELHEALLEFFPERFLELYEQKKEKIKYKSLPKLIAFYNSKN